MAKAKGPKKPKKPAQTKAAKPSKPAPQAKPATPPEPRRRSDDDELDNRVDAAEDMLVAGLGRGAITKKLVTDFEVSTRQARRYIEAVYERWRAQSTADAPMRREMIWRMAVRLFAKATAASDYRAAASALTTLAKLASGFVQHDPERDARVVAELGDPPAEPRKATIYAQRCMLFMLREIMTSATLDPERRLRWVCEYASKLGLFGDRGELLADLEQLERAYAALKEQLDGQVLDSREDQPS